MTSEYPCAPGAQIRAEAVLRRIPQDRVPLTFKCLATRTSELEGKKVELTIAQIAEVQKILLRELAKWTTDFDSIVSLLKFLHRYSPEEQGNG